MTTSGVTPTSAWKWFALFLSNLLGPKFTLQGVNAKSPTISGWAFFRLIKTYAVVTRRKESTQVFADQPCQFKHGDLVFAKHRFEFGIGIDGAFVGGILQALRLDVVPQLLHHFCARHFVGANHCSQIGARREVAHCGFAWRFGCSCFLSGDFFWLGFWSTWPQLCLPFFQPPF